MSKDLTVRQREVLQFIVDFKRQNEMPPTRREICKHFGFKVDNAAQEHLYALRRKGYVEMTPNIARGLKVLRELSPL